MCVALKSSPAPLEDIANLLDYDLAAGTLYWRIRPREMFSSEATWRSWNKRCAHKPALASRHSQGYLHGSIFNRHYFAHVVLWALANGRWPDCEIDHGDGDRTNNRKENLTEAVDGANSLNAKRSVRNASGVTGVHRHAKTGKWRAQITLKGVVRDLGLHDTIEHAAAARKSAEQRMGFHPNHGRST